MDSVASEKLNLSFQQQFERLILPKSPQGQNLQRNGNKENAEPFIGENNFADAIKSSDKFVDIQNLTSQITRSKFDTKSGACLDNDANAENYSASFNKVKFNKQNSRGSGLCCNLSTKVSEVYKIDTNFAKIGQKNQKMYSSSSLSTSSSLTESIGTNASINYPSSKSFLSDDFIKAENFNATKNITNSNKICGEDESDIEFADSNKC